MKSTRYKFNLALALIVVYGGLAAVVATGTHPNLGLDLSGGTSVILTASAEGGVEDEVLQKTVEIIRQRIDALGVAEPEVSAAGGENILVQLPGVEDEERALELIGSTAQLSFRQVLEIIPANQPTPEPTPTPESTAQSPAPEETEAGAETEEPQNRSATQTRDKDRKKRGAGRQDGGKQDGGAEEPAEGEETGGEEGVQEPPEITEEKGPAVHDEEVVYPDANDSSLLYRLAPAGVLTGDVITRAEAIVDTQSGDWSVRLDMNDEGAEAWADITSELACLRDEGEQIRSQVAIVLDGKVETATGMRDPATSQAGEGVECDVGITGGTSYIDVETEQEAKDLALVLQTGALPLTLTQSEVNKVSPTLGRDSLQAGLTAGALGLAFVMLYVLVYYRGLGFVVWAGLATFTAAIYSLLSFLGAAAGLSLTLAGVAGIIVSIGITADSYIVAFERLKDEARSGKTVRAAVERGMTRAFRTILIADFVTGSAAVILFFLAVGPVRGFALTLGLATLIDVLIAYFFTRSAVGLLARMRFFSEGRFIGIKEALGVRS